MVDFSNVLKFGSDKSSGTEYKNGLLKKNILVQLSASGDQIIVGPERRRISGG